MAFVKGKIKI